MKLALLTKGGQSIKLPSIAIATILGEIISVMINFFFARLCLAKMITRKTMQHLDNRSSHDSPFQTIQRFRHAAVYCIASLTKCL